MYRNWSATKILEQENQLVDRCSSDEVFAEILTQNSICLYLILGMASTNKYFASETLDFTRKSTSIGANAA